jgi:membrane protease YdiL (CAAX protease family)
VEDTLRALMTVGLGGLLILLRLDAERFGAAEYDEVVDGERPSLRGRLAWYLLGLGLAAAAMLIHPDATGELGLGLGDRNAALLAGFVYGAFGFAQAAVFAWLRYHRMRWPSLSSYPGALVNAILTAVIDETTFRGILLGFLLLAGLDPWVAIVIQAIVYTLATRSGASGRGPYLLVLSLAIGLVGGWLTVATGGIGAAIIGHGITRFSVFLATGHAGHALPPGAEDEEIEKARMVPDGWRTIGGRDGRDPREADGRRS